MKSKILVNNKFIDIIALSMIFNTLWVLNVHTMPYSDFLYYHELALKISKGWSWGDTYTSAGYSAILGFFYRLLGADILTGKLLNIIFSAANNIIFYLILSKCKISERFKILIISLFAFYPINIIYNGILANEIIFTTVLLLIIYNYLSNARKKHILMGILIAVGSMIKPFFIAFSLCLIIMDVITSSYSKNTLSLIIKRNLLCFFTSLLCILPWSIRNTILVGDFTFISNNGGIVLYVNNNSNNITGKWMPPDKITNSLVNTEKYINSNAAQKNKILRSAAKEWIFANPASFMELGWKRIINTFYKVDDIDYAFHNIVMSEKVEYYLSNLLRKAKVILSNCLFVYIMINMILFCKNQILNFVYSKSARFNAEVIVTTLFFACIYFITEGQGRYSFPINFFSIYTFAIVIHWFYEALKISLMNFRRHLETYRSS